MTYRWRAVPIVGPYSNINGHDIWSDGEHTYYDSGYTHLVYNPSTGGWEKGNWQGLSYFSGSKIWSDGTNFYYSDQVQGSVKNYVLDKANSAWEVKDWGTNAPKNGSYIWSDGTDIYYSEDSSIQYVLNKQTGVFDVKQWVMSTNVPKNGSGVWTDGNTLYYSRMNSTQSGMNLVYDNSSGPMVWHTKVWSGMQYDYFDAEKGIWSPDGGNTIYCSNSTAQYVLDKATSTWSENTFDGNNDFYGWDVWSDVDGNIYCTYALQGTQYNYILERVQPEGNYLSKLVLPVNVSGTITNVEYTLKDAEARQMIEDLGNALYWMGVTTTVLTDGATTNPITINGESVTADLGGLASYNGSEFVWNGSAWQELGKNNFGALAFKSSASGSYTPAGTVSVAQAVDTTTSVAGVATVGTLSEAYFTSSGENVTFNFNAGTLPTADTAIDAVTASGAVTATFTGTQSTITVS